MNTSNLDVVTYCESDSMDSKSGVVELSLLLPTWQVAALEATAHNCGLTAGQMVRHLIREYFGKFAQPRPA